MNGPPEGNWLQKLRISLWEEEGRTTGAKLEILWKTGQMVRRGLWYRWRLKASLGVPLIGSHVKIRNPKLISVGRYFIAEDFCEIQGLSERGLIFGNRVTIGRFAMIRPSSYYGREIGMGLKVGDYSNIGPYCYLGCSGFIEIGRKVLMGPRVTMHAENHNYERTDVPIKEQSVSRSPIIIEDDCWLASDCVILAGVRVGTGAIVAAGAVVNRDVPPFAVVAGIPAKVVKWRRPRDAASKGETTP
jgi:acetyltransferase-like isoleucine patch superfamily enzyme